MVCPLLSARRSQAGTGNDHREKNSGRCDGAANDPSALRGDGQQTMNSATCVRAALVIGLFGLGEEGARAQDALRFVPEEATITSIHAAIALGRNSCEQVIRAYLERIDAYD